MSSFSMAPMVMGDYVTLQHPLTRRAKDSNNSAATAATAAAEVGPGLIIIATAPTTTEPSSHHGERTTKQQAKTTLDPQPLQKWAEEGFTVVQVTLPRVGDDKSFENALVKLAETTKGLKAFDGLTGVIIYDCDDALNETRLQALNSILESTPQLAAIVTYVPGIKHGSPLMEHKVLTSSSSTPDNKDVVVHSYDSVSSTSFIIPGHPHYEAGAAGLAHSRSLTFLKSHLGGPYFDIEQIWDEHTLYEFGERDVEKTMATMVEEPYVNHIPTMTGGIGRSALTDFYRNHFIFSNPEDTKLDLISRTVGSDRVIDEFIFSFTHDRVIDWLIPGIPPTHKHVRIPFTSVVNVRGDRLFHEHIAWDQASVLRQLGLLPEYLPFPYPLPDGRVPAAGKRFEYRVPTAGVETAEKLVDESSVPSNEILGFEIREVDDV